MPHVGFNKDFFFLKWYNVKDFDRKHWFYSYNKVKEHVHINHSIKYYLKVQYIDAYLMDTFHLCYKEQKQSNLHHNLHFNQCWCKVL